LGAKLLAEGLAIRATGRILEVDKDTVGQWVPHLGRHSWRVMAYFFRNLHITECQLDELWTFVRKKENRLAPVEQVLGIYGDAWTWIAFAPACKLVVTWVVGKRTLTEAKQLIKRLKTSLNGHIPFFTSDELPHYADALLDQYGEVYQPPKRPGRGRPPLPYKIPPADLLYAVVVKHREQGRVVEVTTEVVYGAPARIAEVLNDSPTSNVISTYGVERNNLTIRQHSRRMGRKSLP
jgi:IS1 family transposase